MSIFLPIALLALVVMPLGILFYFWAKRIRKGRGFEGWQRSLAWSFLLPALPFIMALLAMLLKHLIYYDAGKLMLLAILLAPVTFATAIFIALAYLVSAPGGHQLKSGLASLLINCGCFAGSLYFILRGTPLT